MGRLEGLDVSDGELTFQDARGMEVFREKGRWGSSDGSAAAGAGGDGGL